MTTNAYVYMLAHATEPRVKIGKALNVLARAKTLGSSKFDFDRSKVYGVDTEDAAYQLERILHTVFAGSRLKSDAIGNGAREDGDTEWFSIDCMEKAGVFLEKASDFIQWKPVEIGSFQLRQGNTPEDQARHRAEKEAKEKAKLERVLQKRQALQEEVRAATGKYMAAVEQGLSQLTAKVERIALLKKGRSQYLIFSATSETMDEIDEIATDLLHATFKTSAVAMSIFGWMTKVGDLSRGEIGYSIRVDSKSPFTGNICRHADLNLLYDQLQALDFSIDGWGGKPMSEESLSWASAMHDEIEDNKLDFTSR